MSQKTAFASNFRQKLK